MTDQTHANQENIRVDAAIHLYFPLYTPKPEAFRLSFLRSDDWTAVALKPEHYMRYIRSICYDPHDPRQNPLAANALVLQHDGIQGVFWLREHDVSLNGVRLYCFDTSIAFLDLKMEIQTESLAAVANITSDLRQADKWIKQRQDTEPNGDTPPKPYRNIQLEAFAEKLLDQWDKTYRMFDHIGKDGAHRADMFVAVHCDREPEGVDFQMYRIAEGLDSRYEGTPPEEAFYAQHSYLRWAITSKSVCSLAFPTSNQWDRKFTDEWISRAEAKHVLWYILAIHQRHAMYRKLNEISQKETLHDLRKYQEEIVFFNTKYRFALVAEDPAYQVPYQMLRDAKQTESVFADIDEEIERINDYHDTVDDRNNVIAMTIVSLICMISTVIDVFQLEGIDGTLRAVIGGVAFLAFLIVVGILARHSIEDWGRQIMRKWRHRSYSRSIHAPCKDGSRLVRFLKNSKLFGKFGKKG